MVTIAGVDITSAFTATVDAAPPMMAIGLACRAVLVVVVWVANLAAKLVAGGRMMGPRTTSVRIGRAA